MVLVNMTVLVHLEKSASVDFNPRLLQNDFILQMSLIRQVHLPLHYYKKNYRLLDIVLAPCLNKPTRNLFYRLIESKL